LSRSGAHHKFSSCRNRCANPFATRIRQSFPEEGLEFLRLLAHDFNNVLGIIDACAEFLHDRIDSAAKLSLYVENIKKAIERGSLSFGFKFHLRFSSTLIW
jgi:hypothetical protein